MSWNSVQWNTTECFNVTLIFPSEFFHQSLEIGYARKVFCLSCLSSSCFDDVLFFKRTMENNTRKQWFFLLHFMYQHRIVFSFLFFCVVSSVHRHFIFFIFFIVVVVFFILLHLPSYKVQRCSFFVSNNLLLFAYFALCHGPC